MPPLSPAVGDYTSRGPFAVGPKEPLGNARHLMDKYGLRDLPVRAEGKLVGVLSERIVRVLWSLRSARPETLSVEDAMSTDAYAVEVETPLDEVLRAMVARKLDVAIVQEQGRVIGVFAASDAMRALVDTLEGRPGPGDKRMGTAPSRPARGARAPR